MKKSLLYDKRNGIAEAPHSSELQKAHLIGEYRKIATVQCLFGV